MASCRNHLGYTFDAISTLPKGKAMARTTPGAILRLVRAPGGIPRSMGYLLHGFSMSPLLGIPASVCHGVRRRQLVSSEANSCFSPLPRSTWPNVSGINVGERCSKTYFGWIPGSPKDSAARIHPFVIEFRIAASLPTETYHSVRFCAAPLRSGRPRYPG